MPETVAVILAGGRGTRMGAERNKVFLDLLGRPVIEWSLSQFARHRAIDRVVLVAHPDEHDLATPLAATYGAQLVSGGSTRPDSERNALAAMREDIDSGRIGAVLIHDGARPLVSNELISRIAHQAQHRGAFPSLPAPVLIDRRTRRPPDQRLVRAQTPQGAPAAQLVQAYQTAAQFAGTDTVSYLEYAGFDVIALDGDEANLKVTYPPDLQQAAELLARR